MDELETRIRRLEQIVNAISDHLEAEAARTEAFRRQLEADADLPEFLTH